MGLKDIVIEARALSKIYTNAAVLDHLDFKINEGECFGFLGPTGAGKTTLIRILSCCTSLTSGNLFITGLNVREHQKNIKRQFGAISDCFSLDSDFSVLDNLITFGQLHGFSRARATEKSHQLLRLLQLEDKYHWSVDRLSLYQGKLLQLARALVPDPKLLYLEIIRTIKASGKTIVLATSSIHEVEMLCDRVALLHHGKILYEGDPDVLVEKVIGHEVVEFYCATDELDYYLARLKERFHYQVCDNRVRVFMEVGQESRSVLSYVPSENLTIRRSHLGDVFLRTTGREL